MRQSSLLRLAAHLGLGLTLLVSAQATAQQQIEIKLRVLGGERYSFDAKTSIKQKGVVNVNGQPAQQIDSSATQRRKGTLEILSVENGKPSAVRVIFDPESASEGSVGGQPVPQFSLAGKTITIRRGQDGAATNDLPDQPDAQTLSELNRMLDPDTSSYPNHLVSIGDAWDADTTEVAKQFQLGPDDKASIKCKLVRIREVDGRPTADVGISGEIVKHDQGFIETTTNVEGSSQVDLKTGQTIGADVTGKMTTRGNKDVNGANGQAMKIDVNAEGTIESHQTVALISGAAPAEAGIAPPPMHDNPLAPRAASFAGTYKGNELALELAGDPGHYTGTLTLQDKKYPVTGHSDGNKLTGSFESDGAQFDVSATLDSDTLTLTSGGNTYTLKKPAANPLARPKPKNPLAQ
jgi:hypothetical protein